MQACFIGHRTIDKTEEVSFLLKETVVFLIKKGVTTFLFGSKSEFDDLSWKIVTELKRQYSFIKRVYVRSMYKKIDNFYEQYLLESFESTYFPPKIEHAGKYSYVERNFEMIDNSTYCVFYYNEKYIPSIEHKPKNNMLFPRRRNSGTKIAYEYAKQKKKEIINLYRM